MRVRPGPAAAALLLALGSFAGGPVAGVRAQDAPAPAAKPEEDVLFRAMGDEMDRSMKRLRLEDKAPPYYIAYTVDEKDAAETTASFGAVTSKGGGRNRSLEVDVRVGDYSLDSSSAGGDSGFFGFFGRGGGGPIGVDDDYDAARHQIWQSTDAAYKGAIEALEGKKAKLQKMEVKDRPDDFSREKPVTLVEPKVKLDADPEKWAEVVRRASAVFKEYPSVQSSFATFMAESGNRWFLNSEGFRNRRATLRAGILLVAGGQATDGMRISDFEAFAGRTPADLPPVEEVVKAARALAERLTKLAAAPTAEEYRGPVIFEGPAAAEFLSQTVSPQLGGAHFVLGEDNPMMGNQWKEKIGQKVLASFLTILSDPTADSFKGAPLMGGWKVDDDGVLPVKLTLVEKGVLKTFCQARVPGRQVKASNGHSRGGVGAPGILFLQSDRRLSPKDLRAKAFELAKEEGLDRVIVVRRLSNILTAALNPQSLASMFGGFGGGGGGGVALLPPLDVRSVSLADGSETPIRGATFGNLTLRVLRDIEATGDDEAPHLVIKDPESVSHFVTPSLLVKEIEIRKPGKETDKLPVTPNPWFEKK